MQLHVIVSTLASISIWCLEWRNTVEFLRQNHIDHFYTKISWFSLSNYGLHLNCPRERVCGILNVSFGTFQKNWPRLSLESLASKTCCMETHCNSQRKQRIMLAIVIKNFIVLLKSASDDEKSLNRPRYLTLHGK